VYFWLSLANAASVCDPQAPDTLPTHGRPASSPEDSQHGARTKPSFRMRCDPRRASVCAGHEQEVICVHNFMPRVAALDTRVRLDERHAQLLAGRLPPRAAAASRRPGGPRILPRGLAGPRPHREAGSEFNQTEVPRQLHQHHGRPLNPNPNPTPQPKPQSHP
jgi:hypothetical protein